MAAPSQFSNHPPTDYNFWPLSLALLTLGAVTLLLALSRSGAPRLEGVGACLLAFLGWNLLSTLTGVYAHDAWLELARLSGGVALYFAARALSSHMAWLEGAVVAGALLAALGAIGNFALDPSNTRQQGAFLNANLFAALLAPSLTLALGVAVEVWRRTRATGLALVAFLPFVAIGVALALTSSKGGFAAAVFGLALWVVLVTRAKGALLGSLVRRSWPVLLVLALVFGAVGAKTVGPRLLRARGSEDNSTQFRVYLWRGTLDMARARPVVGFGPGSFPTVYPRFALVGYTRTAHQSWLQIAAESGAPALLLLLSALIFAVRASWRQLKSANWASNACGLAALSAICVHSFVDAPLSVMSVWALFCLALALCVGEEEPSVSSPRGLNFPFLGATLLLIVGGYGAQKAAQGEELRTLAEDSLRRGLFSNAAVEATQTDPGSARLWNFLGRATPVDNRTQWENAFKTASTLQPDNASHPRAFARQIASLPAPSSAELAHVAALYDRAVALDPLNSSLRLERAKWRLDHKDGRGFDDLEFVLSEWDAPYGKYPALGRDLEINLDFARATLAIGPRLKAQKQTARLQTLVKRAMNDCAEARQVQKKQAAILNVVQGQISIGNYGDLDALEVGLRALV